MTSCNIHTEWLGHFITRYYHFMVIGWKIQINANGSWRGVKKEVETK